VVSRNEVKDLHHQMQLLVAVISAPVVDKCLPSLCSFLLLPLALLLYKSNFLGNLGLRMLQPFPIRKIRKQSRSLSEGSLNNFR
jgi:hypothetical protein